MEKKQFNLYLDEDLIKAVKHAAIESEQRLSDYVADILRSNLADKRPERAKGAEGG